MSQTLRKQALAGSVFGTLEAQQSILKGRNDTPSSLSGAVSLCYTCPLSCPVKKGLAKAACTPNFARQLIGIWCGPMKGKQSWLMLVNYAFILILSVFGIILPLTAIIAGWVLGPRKPDPVKTDIYESGLNTIGDTWIQFRAQFYLIGLVFLVFDLEVIFLFPIAMAYGRPGFGLAAALVTLLFMLLLIVGLVYDWRKGGLEWQ